jgi:hypothetical protein
MTSDPKLTVAVRDPEDGVQTPVDFRCELPYVEDRLVNYEVEWSLNDVVIHKDRVTEVGGVSILKDEMLNGKMDMNSVRKLKA